MKTITLFLLGLLAFAQGRVVEISGPGSRIVNGVDVNLGEIPFQVSLQLSRRHFCGGSIVNKNWVVTAAHCVIGTPVNGLTVVVGTIKLSEPHQVHTAELFVVHENYNPDQSFRNDIALIKVAEPFEFSENVKPVALPELHNKVKTNITAVVSGWGGLYNSMLPWSSASDILQKAEIYIADPEYCTNVMEETGKVIYPTNVCAYDPSTRRGQCNGDAGGPLVVDGKLTGIFSWTIKDPDCASTKYPGVYTRVSEFEDWILNHAQ